MRLRLPSLRLGTNWNKHEGKIQDVAGNNATLTLAAPGASGSLGANKNLVVDTTSPTVTGVSATTEAGALRMTWVSSLESIGTGCTNDRERPRPRDSASNGRR